MMSILLVDDEYLIREGIAGAVDWKSNDCRLAGTAADGVEALEAYRRLKPDCIITDIRMPRMNGLELIRRIRALDKMCKLVILTGYEEFKIAREAMKYGVNHYLLKPFDEEELIEVLSRIRDECRQNIPTADDRKTNNLDVNRMLGIIRESHRRQDLSLAWIADTIVFKNRDYLGKIFHEHIGQSFNRYLNEYRVAMSAEILTIEPRIRVCELAERVGYAPDGRYFTTQFRRINNQTISEFRRSLPDSRSNNH